MHKVADLQNRLLSTVAPWLTEPGVTTEWDLTTGPNLDVATAASNSQSTPVEHEFWVLPDPKQKTFCLLWRPNTRLVSQKILVGHLHSVPPDTLAVTFAFKELSSRIAAMTPFRGELFPQAT
jgi:hypothetical protein